MQVVPIQKLTNCYHEHKSQNSALSLTFEPSGPVTSVMLILVSVTILILCLQRDVGV